MKNVYKGMIAVLAAGVIQSSVYAETELYKQDGITVKTDAALRVRQEFQNWAGPAALDTRSDFGHAKLQVGIGAEGDIWKAYLQGQYFQLYSLDSNLSGGPGAAYFSTNNRDDAPGGLTLRQGFLTLRDSSAESMKATAGRFLYSGGAEVAAADPAMNWIKTQRISQRLIGPFDFTGGRSFDGGRVDLKDNSLGTLTVHGSHPTQGGFETNSFETISDITLATAAWSLPFDSKAQDGQLFYYNYDDNRNVVKTDNRGLDIRTADTEDINISTVGGHYVRIMPTQNARFDTVAWGAYQFGDWGALDQDAYSYDLEAGVQFPDVALKPWLRAGYTFASGDSKSGDSNHKTFFPRHRILHTGDRLPQPDPEDAQRFSP